MNDKEICEQFAQWLEWKIFNELDLEGVNMDHYRTIKINNAPMNLKAYTVCRVFEEELWFWGTYEEKEQACKVAKEIGGVIIGAY